MFNTQNVCILLNCKFMLTLDTILQEQISKYIPKGSFYIGRYTAVYVTGRGSSY